MAKRYDKQKQAAELRERPKVETLSSLHTRASQAQSKIRQIEKRPTTALDRLDSWRKGATELEGQIKDTAADLDRHESQYKELVIQIRGEVQVADPAPHGAPKLSLKALVE